MTEAGTSGQVRVSADSASLAQAAADEFAARAGAAIEARGMFLVALSGGSTPRALFERLAGPPYRDQIDWSRVQVFFSDERFVPPDSPDSNYHMANEALLSRVPIPERFVHPVATVDIPPEEAAVDYEQGIRRVFDLDETQTARFDLILLGLGDDGHTASLFPGTEALRVRDRLVVPNHVPKLDAWRITFTYPLIDAAQCVAFLVQGEGKADILAQVLGGADLPAAGVKPTDGELLWLVDQAAAAGVPPDRRSPA